MKILRCALALFLLSSSPCLASRLLVDELGRSVNLPEHPHRVLCLVPSVTDTVFALGAEADVVAISDFTGYPTEALNRPSVGSTTRSPIETILSLHSDLVIGFQTGGPSESTAQIERLGIPVFLRNPLNYNRPRLQKTIRVCLDESLQPIPTGEPV